MVQADISVADDAQQLVETSVQKTERIDILVNNAGIFEPHPISEINYDQWLSAWQLTIDANLLGAANVTYWAAQHMKQHGGGRIVNVSSRGAFRGEPEAPAYAASKAGLNAMSQSLAQALAPYNIYVYTVAPGWFLTDMTAEILASPRGEAIRAQSPLNRVGDLAELARTVLFLASEGTDYLTGCIVDVNGASYLRT